MPRLAGLFDERANFEVDLETAKHVLKLRAKVLRGGDDAECAGFVGLASPWFLQANIFSFLIAKRAAVEEVSSIGFNRQARAAMQAKHLSQWIRAESELLKRRLAPLTGEQKLLLFPHDPRQLVSIEGEQGISLPFERALYLVRQRLADLKNGRAIVQLRHLQHVMIQVTPAMSACFFHCVFCRNSVILYTA